jgi:2-octaprenyl-6-methoxyphenol hydroxylase
MQFDVVIIGGGPTGVITALSLEALGLKIAILDQNDLLKKNKKSIVKDGRAIALSSCSKEILEKHNLWKHLKDEAGEIKQIRVTDSYSPLFLHFDNNIIKNAPMGYMVENNHIISILISQLIENKNITILPFYAYNKITCEDSFIKINVKKNQDILAKLLIVAEGKFSKLREECHLKTHDWTYPQSAVVCNVRHKEKHYCTAQEMFTPSGPFALLPLKDQYISSIVWTESPESTSLLMSLPKEEFKYFLKQKITDYLGDIEVVSEKKSYPLSVIFCTEYFRPRIAFLGETIHSFHPLAGQGLNQTIKDIDSLVNNIQNQLKLGLDIGSTIMLENYQKERILDNFAMLAITDGLNKLFSNNLFPINIIRKTGLSIFNNMPSLKKFFMDYAMGKR